MVLELTLDVGEASSMLVLQGNRGLFCPASSGKVSYNRVEIVNNFIVKERCDCGYYGR